MALYIYTSPSDELSTGDAVSPFTVTIDGISGGAINRKLYVRNDNPGRWYDSIIVQAIDSSSPSIADGSTTGFSWKLSATEDMPPIEQWQRIDPGNQIELGTRIGDPELPGDIVTFLPFWIRIEVPRNQRASNITSVSLRVTAREYLL
jgi:hypothetical protein